MDNEPLIALISFGDSREDMFERRRCIFEREIGAVEQWLSLSCNIAYKFEVNNQEAVYEAVSSLRLKNVDVAILYLPIWSFPSLVVSCAKLLNNLPVLLLANSKKETSSIGGMLGAAGGLGPGHDPRDLLHDHPHGREHLREQVMSVDFDEAHPPMIEVPRSMRSSPRGDRRAVVVQDRHQPRRVHLLLGRQQRAQLRIAILLDDEHGLVRGDERIDRGRERERADAQRVDRDALRLQRLEGLVHRRAGRAVVDDAVARRGLRGPGGAALDRLRHQRLRGLELGQQALHVVDVVGPAF